MRKINPMSSHKIGAAHASQRMIWVLSATVVLFIGWSSVAQLDQIVRGPGKLVPTSNTQVIQSLEGGILSELLVWEGKVVEKGEVLARLSDKRFKGAFKDLEVQVISLDAKLKRLDAEISLLDTFTLSDEFWKKAPRIAESETQLYHAKTTEFRNARQALKASLELHEREVEILEASVRRRIAPEIDLVNARQTENDVRSQLSALESEYALTRTDEYSTTLNELNQAKANLAIRKDQLNRTVLIAPTKGIVNKVLITTIGGVAPPGEPILELTPLDEELRIEAEILPRDVASIYPGMRSTVKLSAFDYTIYGSFEGKVLHVSADTFEKPNNRDAEPYYKVLISLDGNSLEANGEKIEIRPGMLADAELHVGKQTVLTYLVKPLFKASTAFREP